MKRRPLRSPPLLRRHLQADIPKQHSARRSSATKWQRPRVDFKLAALATQRLFSNVKDGIICHSISLQPTSLSWETGVFSAFLILLVAILYAVVYFVGTYSSVGYWSAVVAPPATVYRIHQALYRESDPHHVRPSDSSSFDGFCHTEQPTAQVTQSSEHHTSTLPTSPRLSKARISARLRRRKPASQSRKTTPSVIEKDGTSLENANRPVGWANTQPLTTCPNVSKERHPRQVKSATIDDGLHSRRLNARPGAHSTSVSAPEDFRLRHLYSTRNPTLRQWSLHQASGQSGYIPPGQVIGNLYQIGNLVKSDNHADVYEVELVLRRPELLAELAFFGLHGLEARAFDLWHIPEGLAKYRARSMNRLKGRTLTKLAWKHWQILIYFPGPMSEETDIDICRIFLEVESDSYLLGNCPQNATAAEAVAPDSRTPDKVITRHEPTQEPDKPSCAEHQELHDPNFGSQPLKPFETRQAPSLRYKRSDPNYPAGRAPKVKRHRAFRKSGQARRRRAVYENAMQDWVEDEDFINDWYLRQELDEVFGSAWDGRLCEMELQQFERDYESDFQSVEEEDGEDR